MIENNYKWQIIVTYKKKVTVQMDKHEEEQQKRGLK